MLQTSLKHILNLLFISTVRYCTTLLRTYSHGKFCPQCKMFQTSSLIFLINIKYILQTSMKILTHFIYHQAIICNYIFKLNSEHISAPHPPSLTKKPTPLPPLHCPQYSELHLILTAFSSDHSAG